MGYAREDFAGKPVIAIINTWSDINPCHAHFRTRAEEVKRGVWQAGGFPLEMPAIALAEYVARMKEGQKAIYYLTAETHATAKSSPHLEIFRARGVEVLLLSDPVDEWVVQHLTEFEGKRLINASREGLKLEEGDKEKKRDEKYKQKFKPLLDYVKETLGKKVEKVSISKHLVQSPVVVLSADYGWTAQMEKVMKSQAFADQTKFEFMKSKRMFEVNPRHPMIVELNTRLSEKPEGDDKLKDMVFSLYLSAVVLVCARIQRRQATGTVTESASAPV
jgi:HSP90 family molecular chaperone